MFAPHTPKQDVPLSGKDSRLFAKVWWLFLEGVSSAIAALLRLVTSGTHADRLALDGMGRLMVDPAKYVLGGLFFETDRTVEYQIRLVGSTIKTQQWVYASGEMTGATLADLPADLGGNDAGFLFHDSNLQHSYKWDGSAWSFGPADDHMAGQVSASAGGAVPRAGAWQACNGSTVTVSVGDGTTANVTTPILTGDTFLAGAAAQSAVRAAARATWEAGAVTDNEAAHTHAVGQTLVLIPAAGTLTNVDTAANTGAGTAHHHALTDANAQLKVPGLANGGLPANISLVWYMRR